MSATWQRLFSSAVLCLVLSSHPSSAADLNPSVAAWLAAQTNVQTWSADFVQTRALQTLTEPLMATGHVVFAAPNRFRWEMAGPAPTIAVRGPQELLIIYPRLKRVERIRLTGEQTGPWRDALALLEAGFPRSQVELERQYVLRSQSVSNHTCELKLQPKAAAARRMIPQVSIQFDTGDFSLKATELQFSDGSTMRNDFRNTELNPKVDPATFSPSIPPDFKVVEPLKSR